VGTQRKTGKTGNLNCFINLLPVRIPDCQNSSFFTRTTGTGEEGIPAAVPGRHSGRFIHRGSDPIRSRVAGIHAELADDHGIHAGCKRVAHLMRAAGLYSVTPRRFIRTTVADPAAEHSQDLVERQFAANGPDQLRVADITYIPSWSGFLYLAVVLDVSSRRIVGWAMETHLRTELVLSALNMALWQCRAQQMIHHSDLGSQVGFKGSSQHWVIPPSILAHRVPRLESASRGFSGVGC
jgi:hypothetical protein